MPSLNKVFLIGNLTRDPEVRHLPSGQPVGDLRMAVTRRYRLPSGEDKEETCFISVTVWGKQAETASKYLSKGSPVFIEGRLKLDEWERDGQKQSKIVVVAERVQFLGAPRRAEVSQDHEMDESQERPAAPGGRPPANPPRSGGGDDQLEDENLPF